jgi:hypothetical protein
MNLHAEIDLNVHFGLPAQLVDVTQALNLSAGVSKSNAIYSQLKCAKKSIA